MRKTRSGLPKHCSWAADRHGKRRVRFRRGMHSVYLTGTPWSPDFMRQYGEVLAGAKPERSEIGAERTISGSFDALVVRYYGTAIFTGLKASTAATYRGIIERFRADFGKAKVRDMRRDHFEQIVGKMADRKAAANNMIRVIRLVLDYAVDIEWIEVNPLAKVKGFKRESTGFHTWTEDEIQRFEARHPVGTRARLALSLLLYTGQRRGDVVRMGRQHVRGNRIAVVQQKTGVSLLIPMHPNLVEAIAAMKAEHLTYLVTQSGSAFTSAGFGNWFREACNEAGLKNCTAHGLRKAAARRLAEAGVSTKHIMSVTGHTTLKEIERYTRDADQVRMADDAFEAMARQKQEQKLPNHEKRLG